jgi:hypothetical protein
MALVLLRFLGPRPGLRQIARQPGAAACWAASVTVLARYAMAAISIPFAPQGARMLLYGAVIGSSYLPGPAVGAVWLNLVLGRRWRPDPSWIDRAGRVVGVFWMVYFVVGSLPI